MESLNLIYPLVAGSIIVPLVAWIKTRMPADFPLQAPVISSLLNVLVIWVLSQLLYPDMTLEQILNLALAGQVTGQFVHAGIKTTKKLTLIGDSK